MTMLVYPQLATGALCQFPLQKTHRRRTVVNRAADGSEIKLADPAYDITQWRLQYVDLSDQEAQALADFFSATEGSLNGFTFVDPAGNLLSSTDELSGQVWQKDPMLAVAGGIADPAGGTNAWQLVNSGAAEQAVAQTIEAPGGYLYCLSAYVLSAARTNVGLVLGAQIAQRTAGTSWSRVVAVGSGDPSAQSMRFGVQVSAGATVQVYGIQVEAQGGASAYKSSTRGGVYTDAHFGSDELSVTSTAVNRNSCTVNITHANHL